MILLLFFKGSVTLWQTSSLRVEKMNFSVLNQHKLAWNQHKLTIPWNNFFSHHFLPFPQTVRVTTSSKHKNPFYSLRHIRRNTHTLTHEEKNLQFPIFMLQWVVSIKMYCRMRKKNYLFWCGMNFFSIFKHDLCGYLFAEATTSAERKNIQFFVCCCC